MTAPIELFYWPTPNGWKISIALEEMGLPYEVHPVNIGKGEQFEPDFLKISPNNRRCRRSSTPRGRTASRSRSSSPGAILQYLARKTGQFCGPTERDRIRVDEWLLFQVGDVGPMAGQAHHFLRYAPSMDPPNDLPYAKDRYRTEVGRLYKVLDRQLAAKAYVAGDFYSIADMAIWPWAQGWENQEQTLDDKPNLKRWLDELAERPAVQAGRHLREDLRSDLRTDRDAQKVLFGRRD